MFCFFLLKKIAFKTFEQTTNKTFFDKQKSTKNSFNVILILAFPLYQYISQFLVRANIHRNNSNSTLNSTSSSSVQTNGSSSKREEHIPIYSARTTIEAPTAYVLAQKIASSGSFFFLKKTIQNKKAFRKKKL